MTVLDRFDRKLHALRSWFEKSRPPSYGIAHGFATAGPMAEFEVHRIEQEAGVSFPPQYRSFLLRFGDGLVGPGWFHCAREGLTQASSRPFPLSEPLLGTLSPAHQRLPKEAQWEDYKRLLEVWEQIPHHDGILLICNYGCAIYGALVLNGSFRDKVWILCGDNAYYGPFGGSEPLHDECAPTEWEPTDSPRDYSFFEWYEHWLDGHLKIAGLAEY